MEFDEYIGSKNYILIKYNPSSKLYYIVGFDNEPIVSYMPDNYYPKYQFYAIGSTLVCNYGWTSSLNDLFLTPHHVSRLTIEEGSSIFSFDAYEKGSDKVVYSNFDIYCGDKLVFSGSSSDSGAGDNTGNNTGGGNTTGDGEILKILIPIGLIIFGIGLVIYLVRLVISRVT